MILQRVPNTGWPQVAVRLASMLSRVRKPLGEWVTILARVVTTSIWGKGCRCHQPPPMSLGSDGNAAIPSPFSITQIFVPLINLSINIRWRHRFFSLLELCFAIVAVRTLVLELWLVFRELYSASVSFQRGLRLLRFV